MALVTEQGRAISYSELAGLADAFAGRLPAAAQLVALQAGNCVDAIAAYLGCLRHGHPVILLNQESLDDGRIVSIYKPNWTYTFSDSGWQLNHLSATPGVYADKLAVLLSTSGTTGAPKLVKLSQDNISSNAASIAEYLGLGPDERAITTLNFFYSFGMSVLNSHLAVGARLVLTDQSVVSPAFWLLFKSAGVTSLAMVPSQFDLLDGVGFTQMDLPSLRYVTQAGGRLHADKLKRYAECAREKGWRFFVMYGQTEASPRMSYVPPDDLLDNLHSIGRPVPGGQIVLLDNDGAAIDGVDQVGELVYRGPNVMLGYANSPADLALPRDTVELRTGDMAKRQPNGYFQIVGRLKRFIKLYGLRINLDEVETRLNKQGYSVYCGGTDETLSVFHTVDLDGDALKRFIVEVYGIQLPQINVRRIEKVPLLPSGKIDYKALNALAAPVAATPPARSIQTAFEDVFRQPIKPDDSFRSLGGDSLTFLNLALHLDRVLGVIPPDWERKTVRELEALQPQKSRIRYTPSEYLVRDIAILGVITNHLGIYYLLGGALTLIFMSGFSFAKLHGDRLAEGKTARFAGVVLTKILVLYYLVISLYYAINWNTPDPSTWRWYFLTINMHMEWNGLYTYWFIPAYTQLALAMALLWSLRPVREYFASRRLMFGYAMTVAGIISTALTAHLAMPAHRDELMLNTFYSFYVMALGWCVYYGRSTLNKVIITALILVPIPLFWTFLPYSFEFFFSSLCLAFIWIDRVPLPRVLSRFTMWTASITFYIYLGHCLVVYAMRDVHWTDSDQRIGVWLAGVCLSVLFGVMLNAIATAGERLIRRAIAAGANLPTFQLYREERANSLIPRQD